MSYCPACVQPNGVQPNGVQALNENKIMNIIQELDLEQVAKQTEGKELPNFAPGDTLRVNVKVVEGTRERIQAYEGVCVGRSGAGINQSFTVRKISYGEGVERVFPLYGPLIASVEVLRRGRVRRAKLGPLFFGPLFYFCDV